MRKEYLQGDGSAVVEGRRQVIVHIDHQILLDCDLGIAVLNSCVHPPREVLAYDRIDEVHEVLLGELEDFLGDRQVLLALSVHFDLLQDQLNLK